MPQILVDGRKILDGGIGSFIETLVDGLLETKDFELSVLLPTSFVEEKKDLYSRWDQVVEFIFNDTPTYSLRECCMLPLQIRGKLLQADIWISPHYPLPFFIPCRKVLVIHDTIQLDVPRNALTGLVHKFLKYISIQRADIICTVSQFSSMCLKRTFGCLKDKHLPIIPNAVRVGWEAQGSSSNQEVVTARHKSSFLFVGSDRPHKQLQLFLQAIRQCRLDDMDVCADIVTTPTQDTLRWVSENKLTHCVRWHTNVSDDVLKGLYLQSLSLVTPSQIEGFGLPSIEAMYFGVPVIASRTEVAKEILGDAPWYFESGSFADLARVMGRVYRANHGSNHKNELSTKVNLGREHVCSHYTPGKQAEAFRHAIGL